MVDVDIPIRDFKKRKKKKEFLHVSSLACVCVAIDVSPTAGKATELNNYREFFCYHLDLVYLNKRKKHTLH
jgi:hypothetical protein